MVWTQNHRHQHVSTLRNDDDGIFVVVLWHKQQIRIARAGKTTPLVATFDDYERAEGNMSMTQFVEHLVKTEETAPLRTAHIKPPLFSSAWMTSTVCGDEPTLYDISWHRKDTEPFESIHGSVVVCPNCVRIRAETPAESTMPTLEIERYLASLDPTDLSRVTVIVATEDTNPEVWPHRVRDYAWFHLRPVQNRGGDVEDVLDADERRLRINA